MNEEKKFVIPEVEIVDFQKEDIITLSCDQDEVAGFDGEDF